MGQMGCVGVTILLYVELSDWKFWFDCERKKLFVFLSF